MTPFLSVIVPMYNEEKMVLETIRRVEAFMTLKQWAWELIIVNDGSTDNTAFVVENYLKDHSASPVRFLSYAENKKKGFVARQGVLASKGEYVLLTDADLSSPIKEVERLIRALQEGSDVAVGSRAIHEKGCEVQQTLKRRIAGRVFNFFVQTLVMRGIRDTQCGFKCFKKEAAHFLFSKQKLDGFCFDVEVLYLAKKNGLKIKEVPVMWRQGANSKVRLFQDSILMLKDLFRIRQSANL